VPANACVTSSVSTWIKYTANQSSARAVAKGPHNTETFGLEVDGDDELVFQLRDGNDHPFEGIIDDTRVYDYGLSQDEIEYIAGGEAYLCARTSPQNRTCCFSLSSHL
jgi:hypothetical protein